MAMPIPPPRFRMRLKMPVALPIWSLARVPMVSVVSGTKIRAVAKPLKIFGHMTLREATSRFIPPKEIGRIRQDAEADDDEFSAIDDAEEFADEEHAEDESRSRAG